MLTLAQQLDSCDALGPRPCMPVRRVTRLLVELTTRHDTCELPHNEIITSTRYPHDVGSGGSRGGPRVDVRDGGLTGVSLGGDSFPSRPATVHDGPHRVIERIRDGKGMSGKDGTAASGNTALWALLEEAEMSNAGLARAVVSAAAREGRHLGTGATSVRRMLDGAAPR
jgi:hypothetical protein